ncbi:MAG: amino acid permease [Candidatus Eremiobacteraeota bacterium]|nr:amino acid permease [Candidatus Eremiobacteraeota bacterium]
MIRGIGLRSAIAVNMITMIGIGPLITIPLVIASLHGSLALWGWIIGAIVAACDGLVWAELASRYPGSGGTYVYLREAFGRDEWGRLFAFLFNWQFLFSAPLLLASGYIGFSQYAGYLFPGLAGSANGRHAVAAALGVLVLLLLYRRVTSVAQVGLGLAIVATITLLIVIAAGLPHAHAAAFIPPAGSRFDMGFVGALGAALVITLYDYAGYNDAALVGDEVVNPVKTLPRAILLSIGIIAALYILLQVSILSVVPWQHIIGPNAQYVASTAIATVWGSTAARIVTGLVLITAFASTYGLLLGFSRIPYAAALDGAFFPAFARLHPRGRFPYVSLLVVGLLALPACFFSLDNVIAFLTAGIVLIQAVAQILALFALRKKSDAPFRMWLFPLPAIVALVAWCFIFYSSGTNAMLYGVLTLLGGVIAYFITAHFRRTWPFALFLALAYAVSPQARADTPSWHAGAISTERGYPVFEVDGKPFFVYGAAFFYERVPRAQWEPALRRYRSLGINTIDLYVIWNWHDLSPDASGRERYDFSGRTNPRRDLQGLLKLIHRYGFKTIVRPGPVIRNEWRNGGYPAWLLHRPEYNMPLHDVLEGRYPATATLQNAHSDDAAAEWMANPTHMRYASAWLRAALHAIAPFHQDVIAVALDDDQGAYIDNQTWPAPHFQRYIEYLGSVVRSVVGPRLPLFINTYQMKVTASAPVWAWGNWYQSDAYAIGEHDRSQLEFSTGLIGTQPHLPIMTSEFQAGWLQGADEAHPRPADPANTTLALHTMFDMGARGIVNFPLQDTLDPPGWAAPWTNVFYSWDAALSVQLGAQARWLPTAQFGALVRSYGSYLATLHRKNDLAIAYETSAYDAATLTNAQIAAIAAATIAAQQACRGANLTCALVDLRYAPLDTLRRYPAIVLPPSGIAASFIPQVEAKLKAYRAEAGSTPASVNAVTIAHPAAGDIPNATLMLDPTERTGLLDIVNYGSSALQTPATSIRLNGAAVQVSAQTVPARDAVVVPLRVHPHDLQLTAQPAALSSADVIPLRDGAFVPLETSLAVVPPHAARVHTIDAFSDGTKTAVFENDYVRLFVTPQAGARALVFEDKATRENLFTTIGALRDDVAQPLPASPRDYIAKYTHPMPAGTFNRPYAVRVLPDCACAEFTYDDPDVPSGHARFDKIVTLADDAPAFTVDERVDFTPASAAQATTSRTSFAAMPQTARLETDNGYGLYDAAKRRVVAVAWKASDVTAHDLVLNSDNAMLTLTFSHLGPHRTTFAEFPAGSLDEARKHFADFTRNSLEVTPINLRRARASMQQAGEP